ncbi:MAG: bifunctional hydroxymethylpyrimidine kinase/phosphomethylpyrimidine kinase [Tahibacter sp.]
MPPSRSRVTALTIAGSDSGGGAGIQADLKTFAAFGVHGCSAITAVTAQNTLGVSAVHVLPAAQVRAQVIAIAEDFSIGAIKTGMLANARIARTVGKVIAEHALPNVVVDPVMIATSGARLLDAAAIEVLRQRLLPLAALVTPNIPEAEALTGRRLRRDRDIERAAADLLAFGAGAVLIKGGHRRGDEVIDQLYWDNRQAVFRHPRLDRRGHGTGCTLAAGIAAGLALGWPMFEACQTGVQYVHDALVAAYRPGRGKIDVLDHQAHPTREAFAPNCARNSAPLSEME